MIRSVTVAGLVGLSLTVAAGAAEPAGSAYLQTMSLQAPPFGALQSDGYPWDGVRIQRWRREQPEADWLTVWIDLQTPGLGYRVTPIHWRNGPSGQLQQAVFAQTTLDFLQHSADPPRVDLAVNTVAFFPFPAYDGTPIFLNEPVWAQGHQDRQPDPAAGSRMLGLLPGRAIIDEAQPLRVARPVCAFGSFLEDVTIEENRNALRDGRVVCVGTEPHGRTVAGASADDRVLMLLVADGYHPGVSLGLGLEDAAAILQAAGARQAIFLDGGGSSTLVGRDADGQAVVLNYPAGQQKTPGTLRYVAVNLGFTNLRRGTDPLPAVEGWQAPLYVRTWTEAVTWYRVYPREAILLAAGAVIGVVALGVWLRRRRRRKRAPDPPLAA